MESRIKANLRNHTIICPDTLTFTYRVSFLDQNGNLMPYLYGFGYRTKGEAEQAGDHSMDAIARAVVKRINKNKGLQSVQSVV